MRPSLLLTAPLLAALLYVSARPVGRLPALGPFLDPAHGVWASARVAEFPREAAGNIPGLTGAVEVRYDDRDVPHIFASNEEDAYRALGYVVARDRLFQLELQTRATAGTLTELVGEAALDQDIRSRRLGLAWGAERRYAALDSSSEAARVMRAYSDGVNAYIAAMRPADVPVELKLLGRKPMQWRPEYTLYLLSRMSQTLAYVEEEVRLARVQALVGREAAEALFPVDGSYRQPIQPYGDGTLSIVPRTIPPPGAPDTTGLVLPSGLARSLGIEPGRELAVGSNNWAVMPQRSSSGHALLAGDPHLELTLPSVWYEAHIVVPGRLDVYGVTIPGSPMIVIGFNRDIAWTFTNTGADVLDLYAETVDDTTTPSRYQLDGEWRPLTRTVEEFRSRSGDVLATDTVYFSHRGPMRRVGGGWLSMRWTALDTAGTASQVAAFHGANRAKSVQDFFESTAAYPVPAQNMLVADRSGNIGIRSTGRYPIRARSAAGIEVSDGRTSASDWAGNVAPSEYPQAINPSQGFLVSANQQPVDPRANSAFFGSNWPAPWRAIRINQLLRNDVSVTPDAMRRYQMDAHSARADALLPALIEAGNVSGADGDSREAARLLAEWNKSYERGDRRAILFEAVMSQVSQRLWDELVPPGDTTGRRASTPSSEVVAELLADSTSAWWDNRATNGVERRDHILRAAMAAGLRDARTRWGEPGDDRWAWGRANPRHIHHLLRIPSFSETGLSADGGPSTISPRDDAGTHGASWRMVAELGPTVSTRVIYPGGQSGNPASSRYANRITKWLNGELDEPLVPASSDQLPADRVRASLNLSPRR